MVYREPRISVDYARNFSLKIPGELNTYLPSCERSDVWQSPIDIHFRLNSKIRLRLINAGYANWDDLYNVTVQELEETKILDRTAILDLVSYAHHLSLLKTNDSASDEKLLRILDTNISNSDLIVYESQIASVHKFLESAVHAWSEFEQKVFCRKFFANDPPHKLAKEVGMSGREVISLYVRLFAEFQELSFLGDLIEILQHGNYKILSRWRLMSDHPEFDIRPFNKFPNYRTLDLVVAVMQIREYGETILDLSDGILARTLLKQLKVSLVPVDGPFDADSAIRLIEPSLIEKYLSLLGFKSNHLYWVYPTMEQRDILVNYLKLQGRPTSASKIRADLDRLLDRKSISQKIIDTHGLVIPITRNEYALHEWGYTPFYGVGEIISEYIKKNGPTHIEIVFAILDGYGFSQKRIKEIASEPPLALIDNVCFLMLDDQME